MSKDFLPYLEKKCKVRCADCPAQSKCDEFRGLPKQPKNYLNREEQEHLMCLGALKAELEDVIKELVKRRNTEENKEMLKALRMSSSYLQRGIDIMVKDVPWDTLSKYLAKKWKVTVEVE